MKKACKYCGGIHEVGFECPKKPHSSETKRRQDRAGGAPEDIFRSSYEWKRKREQIQRRDRYLCQACLHGLSGTIRRIEPYGLSVHHIVPLSKDFSQRLSDGNLITLCRYHHERAEAGTLPAGELLKLVQQDPPPGVSS